MRGESAGEGQPPVGTSAWAAFGADGISSRRSSAGDSGTAGGADRGHTMRPSPGYSAGESAGPPPEPAIPKTPWRAAFRDRQKCASAGRRGGEDLDHGARRSLAPRRSPDNLGPGSAGPPVKYPQIAAAVSSLRARQAYLDGELYGLRPDGITSLISRDASAAPDGVARTGCRTNDPLRHSARGPSGATRNRPDYRGISQCHNLWSAYIVRDEFRHISLAGEARC